MATAISSYNQVFALLEQENKEGLITDWAVIHKGEITAEQRSELITALLMRGLIPIDPMLSGSRTAAGLANAEKMVKLAQKIQQSGPVKNDEEIRALFITVMDKINTVSTSENYWNNRKVKNTIQSDKKTCLLM